MCHLHLQHLCILVLVGAIGSFLLTKSVYADHCKGGDVELPYCLIDGQKSFSDKDVDTCPTGQLSHDCLYGSEIVPETFGPAITDPRANIRVAINLIAGFLGIIVVIMVIYGGYFWITAAGNEEKVSKGKDTLIWAAIGAIVISIAWTVASYILEVGRVVGGL